MSSDFESLSCDDRGSRRPDRSSGSGNDSFDSLEDLAAETEARLLRRLQLNPRHQHNTGSSAEYEAARGRGRASSSSSASASSDSSRERASAMYGYREYGVTGPQAPPPAASAQARHSTAASDQRHSSFPRAGMPSDHVDSTAADGNASRTHSKKSKAKYGPHAGVPPPPPPSSKTRKKVRLFTQSTKTDPVLPPPLYKSGQSLGRQEREITALSAPTPLRQTASVEAPATTVARKPAPKAGAGVDANPRLLPHNDPSPAPPSAQSTPTAAAAAAHDPRPEVWLATCPTDSGTITPEASAGDKSQTPSHTTRPSQSEEGSTGTGSQPKPQQAHEALVSLPEAAAAHNPVTIPPPPAAAAAAPPPPFASTRSLRDADGFYRTGLLLEESSDEEDEELRNGYDAESEVVDLRDPSRVSDRVRVPLSSARPTVAAVEGEEVDRGGGAQALAASELLSREAAAAAATAPSVTGLSSRSSPPPPTTPPSSTSATPPPPLTLRGKLHVAREQLHHIAAALPPMTTVRFLSLVITLLVPVNLICLDVMALGWIRRRVDVRSGNDAASSVAGGRVNSMWFMSSSMAGVSSGGSAAETEMNVEDPTRPPSTYHSRCVSVPLRTGVSSAGHHSALTECSEASSFSTASHRSSGINRTVNSSSSGGGGFDNDGAAAAHTVPGLCSLVLWLFVPNGVLFRVLRGYYHQAMADTAKETAEERDAASTHTTHSSECGCSAEGGPEASAAAQSAARAAASLEAEWLFCCALYAHLRRSLPQLALMELYLRYVCLWAMVHAFLPCVVRAAEWSDAWVISKSSTSARAAGVEKGAPLSAAFARRSPVTTAAG